jgi:hypothetical protein
MEFQDNVLNWLLEPDNPPVRYLTLTRLLNKPESNPEVRESRARLMEYAVTQGILEHHQEYWKDDDRAYWKYTGKYWQLIFLGQFLADGTEPRIAENAHSILDSRKWINKNGVQCLTANLLAAFMRLGFRDHPVVVEEIETLAKRVVADGGIACAAMGYSLLSHCYMALPKLLLCFGEVPPEQRSPAVKAAIELIVEMLLAHEVYIYVPGTRKQWQQILAQQPKKADLPKGHTVKAWIADQREKFLASRGLGARDPKQGWLKFGFPLQYNSDILESMYALARVDTPMTPNLQKPLQIITQKMAPDGTWKMENSLNGKMWVDVEEKGEPSKWLTYFALCVLNHFGEFGE